MKNLSRLTGVPLNVYKEIASSHGLYTENKFQYLLKAKHAKRTNFNSQIHIFKQYFVQQEIFTTHSHPVASKYLNLSFVPIISN